MKKCVIKKKKDGELFKELRINTLIIASALIIISIIGFFLTELGEFWYRMVLLFAGFLLISYSLQKYLQEHPKVRMGVMWVLLALAVLGVIVFLFFYTK